MAAPTSLSRLWIDGDRIGGFIRYNVSGNIVSRTQNLLLQVVCANLFQLLISFLYLFYNSLLTKQLVADEFIRYLVKKKPLRVSSPVGMMQRSTYALSLPYRYAIPLMTACVVLHWFISRSIFVLASNVYGPGADGVCYLDKDASRLGFSVTAMLVSILLGSLMLIALLLNGFRRYPRAPSIMPRMATNSAGISALCHRPEYDKDAYLYPVRLVASDRHPRNGDKTKVVCFSTDIQATIPSNGVIYWQPTATKAQI